MSDQNEGAADPPGNLGGRSGDAAVAAVDRGAAQASAAADRRAKPVRADACALRRRAVRAADHRRQPGAGGGASRLLRRIAGALLILEPMKRDSAPAIALAALLADADELLLVCPSDHHIADVAAFHAAIEAGARRRRGGRHRHLRDRARPSRDRLRLYRRRRGRRGAPRRPLRRKARRSSGPRRCWPRAGHYWNAGIFLAPRANLARANWSATHRRSVAAAQGALDAARPSTAPRSASTQQAFAALAVASRSIMR